MANDRLRTLVTRFGIVVTVAVLGVGGQQTLSAQRVAAAGTDATLGTRRVTVNVENVPLMTALNRIAQEAGLVPLFNEAIIPPVVRVTLRVHDVVAIEAFQQALRATGLHAEVHGQGNVVIVRDMALRSTSGTIVGRVTDARTAQPLRGVKIGLDGTERITETNDNGVYRLSNVSAASHTIHAKLLGYGQEDHTVTVLDDAIVTTDVALTPSVMPLDQVVVTGTVTQTELKAVPNAMTVITAKQIEERGITRIDQLFRGDIPGVFALNAGSQNLLDEVVMFSRGATALSSHSSGVTPLPGTTNPIKTYIDGIELADPKYLSQIDPRSIERIEILTGPQASTIYGSNALNGVMQIFTKRGTTNTPQLTLNLESGLVQNNFSSARTPQHNDGVAVSGVEGRMSYNVGGSWQYTGPWSPAKQTTRTNGFGGARLDMPTKGGHVTTDMTFRRSVTQNVKRGTQGQLSSALRETGWWIPVGNGNGDADPGTTSMLNSQTLGLVVQYTPVGWWSHELEWGQDVSENEQLVTIPRYQFRSDTGLSMSKTHVDRPSLKYTTTLRIPVTPLARATITLGGDGWHSLTSSTDVQGVTKLTGTLGGSTTISRYADHNAGGFIQAQLGVSDKVFLTYGLRAEWNPNFGSEAEPNYAPRYGAAYTQDWGPMTVKLRGSYGRSTRPPRRNLKAGQTAVEAFGSDWSSFWSQYFDDFEYTLPNPELTAEYQQGGEGGLELYLGSRGSLIVTRYNQTVDQLIDYIYKADSARTKYACQTDGCPANSYDDAGYGYWYQEQYLNVGSIRNQGWELQGSINTGPLTTKGTYSWTKSRVIGVNAKYRAILTDAQYQPGATFRYLPEHTWAMEVIYAKQATTIGLSVNGTGQALLGDTDFYYQALFPNIRLSQNRFIATDRYYNGYVAFRGGTTLADLNVSRRVNAGIDGTLGIKNLANVYKKDLLASSAVMGRQVSVGARVRL